MSHDPEFGSDQVFSDLPQEGESAHSTYRQDWSLFSNRTFDRAFDSIRKFPAANQKLLSAAFNHLEVLRHQANQQPYDWMFAHVDVLFESSQHGELIYRILGAPQVRPFVQMEMMDSVLVTELADVGLEVPRSEMVMVIVPPAGAGDYDPARRAHSELQEVNQASIAQMEQLISDHYGLTGEGDTNVSLMIEVVLTMVVTWLQGEFFVHKLYTSASGGTINLEIHHNSVKAQILAKFDLNAILEHWTTMQQGQALQS